MAAAAEAQEGNGVSEFLTPDSLSLRIATIHIICAIPMRETEHIVPLVLGDATCKRDENGSCAGACHRQIVEARSKPLLEELHKPLAILGILMQ